LTQGHQAASSGEQIDGSAESQHQPCGRQLPICCWAVRRIGLVVETADGERTAEPFVKEQGRDVDTFCGALVGVPRSASPSTYSGRDRPPRQPWTTMRSKAVVYKNQQAGEQLCKTFHRSSVLRSYLDNSIIGPATGGIKISNMFG
jgi:hypothetical protein